MTRYLLILFLLIGCKSPAPVEPITEQPRDARPAPTPFVPMGTYSPYVNSQHDELIKNIMGPPVLPGRGPFPMHVIPNPPAVSNWMTKAVQPKPMTNQIPGSFILTKITTTDKDGKQFTAELSLEGNSRVQATDKMAVVIFSINTPSYTIEVCTNLLDGKWYPMASGTGGNTNNGALVIVDLKEDSAPIKFYRQKPGL